VISQRIAAAALAAIALAGCSSAGVASPTVASKAATTDRCAAAQKQVTGRLDGAPDPLPLNLEQLPAVRSNILVAMQIVSDNEECFEPDEVAEARLRLKVNT
jgi:hypothetical protein